MKEMDFNSYMNKIGNDIKKIQKKQDKELKDIQKKQDKAIKNALNIKNFIAKEGRVPILAKRRHEVEKLYSNKCNTCKKTSEQLGVKLQIHHKNMKNSDNRLSNLELLCPTHHYAKHGKGKNPKRKKNVSWF